MCCSAPRGSIRGRAYLSGIVSIGFFATLVGSHGVTRGASPSASETTEAIGSAKRLQYMKQAAAQYTIRLDGEKRALKREKPILRWSEPVIRVLDGISVIWTHHGRPAATVDIWVRADGETHHSFQSLSERKLVGERDGEAIWQPAGPGLEFRPIPDAPTPADTDRQRLRQMRALARRLNAYVIGGPNEGSGRIELRLLPRPLYRYQSAEAGVLDGAVFVLGKGTNPEIMILIEAAKGRETNYWRQAAAAKTNREAEVRYRDHTILTLPYVDGATMRDPSRTYFGVVERGPAWDDDR